MLFAHLKRILRLDRLRLRGPSGAKDEFLLAAPPKICGNWPSSSPSRRRSSSAAAVSDAKLALCTSGGAHRARLKRWFFNEIRRLRTSDSRK
jgi:hypothetical protein